MFLLLNIPTHYKVHAVVLLCGVIVMCLNSYCTDNSLIKYSINTTQLYTVIVIEGELVIRK